VRGDVRRVLACAGVQPSLRGSRRRHSSRGKIVANANLCTDVPQPRGCPVVRSDLQLPARDDTEMPGAAGEPHLRLRSRMLKELQIERREYHDNSDVYDQP
jgi:hypothetical protein